MKPISRHMVKLATALAGEIDAKAVLVLADAIENDTELRQLVNTVNFRTILISRLHDTPPTGKLAHCEWITVPDVHMTRTGQVKVALLVCLAKGLLQRGDQVVCLTGIDGSSVIDTCMVLNLGSEPELFSATDGVNLGGDEPFSDDVECRPEFCKGIVVSNLRADELCAFVTNLWEPTCHLLRDYICESLLFRS